MRKVFVYFDLGGTLVDLRGIVTSMAARLQAMRVREPVPLALSWAALSAQALPTAQGPRFRSLREIASDALADLLAKPSESLFASDAALDLQGAANLGMGTAWIRRGLLPDLAKPPPDALILPRMEDVERIVAGYAKTGRFELP